MRGPVVLALLLLAFACDAAHARQESSSPAGAGVAASAGTPRTGLDGPVAVYPAHLAGRTMASGVRYDAGALVAAHPTLPFGTRLEIRDGSRSVVVTVADRGPYDGTLRLVVSAAAGRVLGLGEDPRWMRIRPVGGADVPQGSPPGPDAPDAATSTGAGAAPDRPVPGVRGGGPWTIQLGTFSSRNAADRLAARFSDARVEPGSAGTWRVVFGRFEDRAEAEAWRTRLAGWGADGFIRSVDEPH